MMRMLRWQAALLPLICVPCAWSGTMGGELGATIIEDDLFWVVRLQPELAVGKLGLGLDAELLWEREGVRDDDWGSSHKWVRLVRYVRWGMVGDPIHARLGALDDVTLGHGWVVHHYTNWYDEDFRRLGVQASGHLPRVGGDAFFSSIGRWEVIGTRLWAEPLGALEPSLRDVRFGATAVTDRDPDAATATDDQITIWAADVEFPLTQAPPAKVFLYVDAAKILGHGSGAAVGVGASPGRLAGISGLGVRLERRFMGARFLPEYVDAFYGVDRYDEEANKGKESTLDLQPRSDGWYGELSGTVLDAVEIAGGFSRLQGRAGSGVLHFDFRSRPIKQRWELSGSLNKTAIETVGDLSGRDRTLVEFRIGYRVTPWSLLYVRLRRTFEKQEGGYRPVGMVVPRISMRAEF